MSGSTTGIRQKISGWKRHECLACGCEFRYRFLRNVEIRAASEQDALDKAEDAVDRARERQVDLRPCPDCGYHQPDMVAQFRRPIHLRTALIAGGTMLLLSVSGMSRTREWGICGLSSVLWLAASAFVCAVVHLVIVLRPNIDLRTNRVKAERLLRDGKLEILSPGERRRSRRTPPAFAAGDRRLLAFHLIPILLLVGIAFIPRAEQPRIPDVIERSGGVGRTIRVQVGSVGSFDGHWRASASAAVANADDFPNGVPTVTATSREDTWGHEYSARRSPSFTSSGGSVWVDLQLPDDSALAGKTLQLDVNTSVTYAAFDRETGDLVGSNPQFNTIRVTGFRTKDQSTTIRKKVNVRLTSGWELPSVSFDLQSLAVLGQFLGTLLTVALGLSLAHQSRRFAALANPATFETNAERKQDLQKRGREDDADDDRPRKPRRRDSRE